MIQKNSRFNFHHQITCLFLDLIIFINQTSLFTVFFIPSLLFERVEKNIPQSSILPRLNSNTMYKM
jgi:hypothetical protein